MELVSEEFILASKGPPNLPGYKFLKQIGQGGFGEVWVGYSYEHEKFCAIKLLFHRDSTVNAEYRGLGAGLESPFIVDLLDSMSLPDYHVFVIELVTGGDLYQCGKNYPNHVWPSHLVKWYVAQIALALDHLHREDIVYRDLKTENVLVDSNGHAKLCDFGLCQYLDDVHLGAIYGTALYMSPEMLGRREYGYETDWYSLGVVAFEMLTGCFPRDVDSYGSSGSKHRSRIRLPNVSSLVTQDFVNELLEFDPTKRLASLEGIKSHPWMSGFDWDLVQRLDQKAPYQPNILHRYDVSDYPQLCK